jgi:AcrR family transcriptional regulator
MTQPYRLRRQTRTRGDDARERLKEAAIELVVTKGIGALTTRSLVAAAQLKNRSAVQYYFGSKERLLKELILDFTQGIEVKKRERIDNLEASGGPQSIREILEIYIDYPKSAFEEDPVHSKSRHYFEMVSVAMPDLVLELIEESPGLGSARCLHYLRQFLNETPDERLRQRLALMNLLIFSALSSREAALRLPPDERGIWGAKDMDNTLLDSLEGLLVHSGGALTA